MKKIIVIGLFLSLLAGCSSPTPAPIPVINKSPARYIPEAYEVKHGDSIYKIAWAFGVDYLDIAKWSKLKEPYDLTPGKRVYLKKPKVIITPIDSEASGLREPVTATRLPAKKPAAELNDSPDESLSVSFSDNPGKWNWPAQGKLVGKYLPAKGSNGIQIAGAEGSEIKAAAAGRVVYVGQGLRGYGELVILKHSEEFLSAYAHNKRIIVEEGQAIQAGQQIATMGNTGARSTMLHFEIRKYGKPVDPMQYLN